MSMPCPTGFNMNSALSKTNKLQLMPAKGIIKPMCTGGGGGTWTSKSSCTARTPQCR